MRMVIGACLYYRCSSAEGVVCAALELLRFGYGRWAQVFFFFFSFSFCGCLVGGCDSWNVYVLIPVRAGEVRIDAGLPRAQRTGMIQYCAVAVVVLLRALNCITVLYHPGIGHSFR
ncbi:hypothetical protein HOY80DRAFT_462115 [Tuber brumale]|nr:hypothetical protein HOY80DRAFT_462115 [Tuber brumale]